MAEEQKLDAAVAQDQAPSAQVPQPAPAAQEDEVVKVVQVALTKSAPVPNVMPKMDPKEQARIQAQIGSLHQQNGQFVTKEKGETRVLAAQGPSRPAEGEALDLKLIPTIYFSGCEDGNYIVNHRSSKIFVDGCKNITITINEPILTTTIEIWKCENAILNLNVPVKTLQVDLLKDLTVNWSNKTHMGALVWQHVEGLNLSFADEEKLNVNTGFNAMKEKFPDSVLEIDQFIIRIIEDALWEERCIRLKNGFLSTEREAVDWEKRNDNVKEKYVNEFMKNAGIKLNADKEKKKRTPTEFPVSVWEQEKV